MARMKIGFSRYSVEIKKRYIVFGIGGVLLGCCGIYYASVDRSVRVLGDGLHWQGRRWESTGYNYPVPRWDKTFLATDGEMGNIYGFGHDPDLTYLMRDSLLDNYLYVREGYTIKTTGTLMAIAIRDTVFPVTPERKEIRSILSQSLSNRYRCQFADSRDMSSLRLSYNKSRVTDFLFGGITYDGEFWYFIPNAKISGDKSRHGDTFKTLDCYQIDKQYDELFKGFNDLYRWHSSPHAYKSVKAISVTL